MKLSEKTMRWSKANGVIAARTSAKMIELRIRGRSITMGLVNLKRTHRDFLAVDIDICLVIAGAPISRTQDPDTDGVVRGGPVGFDAGVVIHNSECSGILPDVDSHCEIDFLSGRGIIEVNFRVNSGRSGVVKPALVYRVFQRRDVGGAAVKKRKFRDACVQRWNSRGPGL